MAKFSVESWEDLRVQDSLQRDASVPFTLWGTKTRSSIRVARDGNL